MCCVCRKTNCMYLTRVSDVVYLHSAACSDHVAGNYNLFKLMQHSAMTVECIVSYEVLAFNPHSNSDNKTVKLTHFRRAQDAYFPYLHLDDSVIRAHNITVV
jgi:hypothetical protein